MIYVKFVLKKKLKNYYHVDIVIVLIALMVGLVIKIKIHALCVELELQNKKC